MFRPHLREMPQMLDGVTRDNCRFHQHSVLLTLKCHVRELQIINSIVESILFLYFCSLRRKYVIRFIDLKESPRGTHGFLYFISSTNKVHHVLAGFLQRSSPNKSIHLLCNLFQDALLASSTLHKVYSYVYTW